MTTLDRAADLAIVLKRTAVAEVGNLRPFGGRFPRHVRFAGIADSIAEIANLR